MWGDGFNGVTKSLNKVGQGVRPKRFDERLELGEQMLDRMPPD